MTQKDSISMELNQRAEKLLGKHYVIEELGATDFTAGLNQDYCQAPNRRLNTYQLSSGLVFQERVEEVRCVLGIPVYFLALTNRSGEWIEESRWKPEEVAEALLGLAQSPKETNVPVVLFGGIFSVFALLFTVGPVATHLLGVVPYQEYANPWFVYTGFIALLSFGMWGTQSSVSRGYHILCLVFIAVFVANVIQAVIRL